MRRSILSSSLVCSLGLLAAACDDPPKQGARMGFGDLDDDAGQAASEDAAAQDGEDASEPGNGGNAGSDEDAGSQPAEPEKARPTYAVISSDYTATSISLVDQFGELIAEDYINSGATLAGITTALSGDVVVPTRSGDKNTLVIVDRYKTDVITRLALGTGEIVGQVRTHRSPPAGSTSQYSSNPHDYVYIDATTAWVSRFEPNLDTGIPEIDRGTDLVRIDPTDMELTEEHIDLSTLNTRVSRTDPTSGETSEVDIYARPSGMVRVGSTLVVGLSRLSFDFKAAGDGMVALVDLETKRVTGFPLTGLASCSQVIPVVDAADHVLVSCAGFWAGDQVATSAIVELSIEDGAAKIERQWRAGEHTDAPRSVNNIVSLGEGRVGAVAYGAYPDGDDSFSIVDLDSGEQVELFSGSGAYVLGGGSFDPKTKLLLVPDASADANKKPVAGLRRFSLAEDAPKELDVLPVAEVLGMPVRLIRAL